MELPGSADIADLQFSQFVSCRTKSFFDINQLNTELLALPPRHWDEDENYLKENTTFYGRECAERAIALYETYQNDLIKVEEQKQCLLQVVERNRRKYSTLSKGEIVNN